MEVRFSFIFFMDMEFEANRTAILLIMPSCNFKKWEKRDMLIKMWISGKGLNDNKKTPDGT